MQRRRSEDFEKFYFNKVGLGEGCGCAERVIDMHEWSHREKRDKERGGWLPRRGAWRRFLNKAGLTARPKTPQGDGASGG